MDGWIFACVSFFSSFCVSVCVCVDGQKLSEKRNFRVTTKVFLVQLF